MMFHRIRKFGFRGVEDTINEMEMLENDAPLRTPASLRH